MSLGYTELFADLIWVRQVLYFGEQLTGKGDFRHVDMYLRTAIALDPHFRRLYVWAGVAYTASGLPVTNAAVRMSNEILEMGLRRFPDDWELNFTLGVNYIHELKTSDENLKRAWKMKGAEHIRRAAMSGKGPAWLPVLVATLLTKGGETQAAIRHLEEILLTTEDEKVREHVRNKLKQLHAEAVPTLEKEREEFMRLWRTHMQYVPQDLFVLLGPPPKDMATRELAVPEVMRAWEQALQAEEDALRESGPK